jgi:hypothetical protein
MAVASDFQIETNALWADIQTISGSSVKNPNRILQGMLHTEKFDVPIFKMISLDIVRDYVNMISDQVFVEFQMPLGDYIAYLYTFRDNLEFTVKRTIVDVHGTRQEDTELEETRYKAIFDTSKNVPVRGNELNLMDQETLNKSNIITVNLQLLDRSIEPLRIKTISGTFNKATRKQLIHTLLGGESLKVLVDGKPAVDAMDIVDPDNQEPCKTTVIDDFTPISSIPTFIHEKQGGLYTGGVGTYFQTFKEKRTWFIYPLYDITQFDSTKKPKAIFYMMPSGRMTLADNTYREEADIIHILLSDKKNYMDGAGNPHMNNGVGFRMADAKSYLKKPVELTEEGPVANRTRLNFEVGMQNRKDGLNYAPEVGVSANPFIEYSKVLFRNLAKLECVWNNGNINKIYPGMPCKFMYINNGEIKEARGIILLVHDSMSRPVGGFDSKEYSSKMVLGIVVEPFEDEYIPTNELPGGTFDGGFESMA